MQGLRSLPVFWESCTIGWETSSDEQLHYAILSETENRTLRVFFPEPSLISRIVHLGFSHRDRPGALSVITKLLAREQFNIHTSLLRKTSSERSVWEAMLEYRGEDVIPDGIKDQCEWVAKHVTSRAIEDRVNSLNDYEFKVELPLYPKPKKGAWNGRILLKGPKADSDSEIPPDINAILRDKISEALGAFGGGEHEMSRLLSIVQASIGQDKPSIFLSFPHNAKEHARLIQEALKDEYQVHIYDLRGAEEITSAVLDLIADSDYFIAIWHHDENLPTEHGKYGISPWMPFEYGIAKALKKPVLVVHSDRLDNQIWNRINPGIANPEYKDIYFAKDAVIRIVEHCQRNFSKNER